MPIFKYHGYKQDGSEIKGALEAEGQRDALIKIKSEGIFPKEIIESELSQKKIFSFRKPASFLPEITRNLSTLLSAGVPLMEALGAMASEQKGPWHGILINIKERVAAGANLSRALQAYPELFPDFYTGMVSAGENSGKLPEVLTKLADFMESQNSIKNKIQTALIYPLFMTFVSILIISFLFTFVVPKITAIFEGTSHSLPLITIILIWISAAFDRFWWLLALTAGGAVVFFRRLKRKNRKMIDLVLLKLPMGILQSLYIARFSMTMSFLLSGGLPILTAMNLTARATGNAVLENKIMEAQTVVSQGAKLSSSLEGFPPTFLQIIATGEESGRLTEVLKQAAASYEAEFDRKLSRMVSLLEPMLILFMGLVVGFIVIAVLLPILELNQLIK